MSTNFYIGKPKVGIHIGKRVLGFCFSLNVTNQLTDLKSWFNALSKVSDQIVDEYGNVYTPDEMIEIISNTKYYGDPQPINNNNSIRYGTNLIRSKVGAKYTNNNFEITSICVGHDHEVDLIKGDWR